MDELDAMVVTTIKNKGERIIIDHQKRSIYLQWVTYEDPVKFADIMRRADK